MATESNGWQWPSQYKDEWKLESQRWLDFYTYWREHPLVEEEPPYRLMLHQHMAFATILVTRSYQDLFVRVQGLRRARSKRAALVTGQPGTGKTTWLWYALIRLISAGEQVIVFSNHGVFYLFYSGKVYSGAFSLGVVYLPEHRLGGPIVELLDIDTEKTFSSGSTADSLWPILAASANPSFRVLLRQRGARNFGMPLWRLDDLVQGLPLQHQYSTFLEHLRIIRAGGDTGRLQADQDAADDSAANEAYTLIERYRMGDTEEGAESAGGGAAQQAFDAQLVDDIRTLVDVKIIEFGRAPRDVYQAVFEAQNCCASYTEQVKKLDYRAFKAINDALESDHSLPAFDIAHSLIAVDPCIREEKDEHDGWRIKFKSVLIKQLVVKEMLGKERHDIQEHYKRLYEVPGSSSLAESYFEALGHRVNSDDHSLSRFAMSRTGDENSPQFTYFPPDTPSTPRTVSTPREIVYFDFADLGMVQLGGDKYYIPAASNNPLFDAFIITLDTSNQHLSVIVTVFKMTTSTEHGGSYRGYARIRKIASHVHARLKDTRWVEEHAKDYIKVEYVLVCPDDKPLAKHTWRFPLGWKDGVARCDHRGDVFCLIIPDPV